MGSNFSFFRRMVGEWGSKSRKHDGGDKQAIKQDTLDQVKEEEQAEFDGYGNYLDVEREIEQGYAEPYELEGQIHGHEFFTVRVPVKPEVKSEINRLKAEIKQLKQDRNRWRAKFKTAYDRWCKHWGHKKQPEIHELLVELQKQFDDIMKAGE